MNAPSEDVKDMLLAESSLNLEFAKNLFINREPEKPDNTVTIFDSYGYPPQLTMDGQVYEYPAVQIRVRGNDQRTAWSLINDIYLSLHGRAHETWNEALYEIVYCTGNPALLDWDDNSRVRYFINVNLQRR